MYSCWHSFGACKFKASLVLFCNSFIITPYINRRSENYFLGAFAGNFGSFWKLGGSFFHIFNYILSGSSRQGHFSRGILYLSQTVFEQYLTHLEMFPIFQHMFSHRKNFWIALLPRCHGLELCHLYILFSPFTFDVINFLNSCQVKKMTKTTLEMMMMQVTILLFWTSTWTWGWWCWYWQRVLSTVREGDAVPIAGGCSIP